MLSIRMRRMGARKNPHFRVVVADSSNSPDGAFIEILGHYHPRFEPARISLDIEAVQAWIDKGAQPSDTVRTLLKQIERGELEMTQEDAERPGAAGSAGEEAAPEEAAEEADSASAGPDAASEADAEHQEADEQEEEEAKEESTE